MVTQAQVLVQRHPNEGALWKALSVGQQMLGQDALPALQRARALLPEDGELAANLGALWMARQAWPRAHEVLLEAVRLQPQLAGAHNNLGNVLLALQQPAQALAAFDAALRLQPGLAAARGNRARALLALGRHDEAADAFDGALAVSPQDAALHLHAATALRAAGRTAQAAARLQDALQRDDRLTQAWFTLGELRLEQGDAAGAVAAWERLVQLDPGHVEAACNLSQLQPSRGEAVLRAALAAGASGERRAAVLANLGGLLLQAQRLSDAAQVFRDAVAAAPSSAQALSNLAQVLRRQGALDDADRVLTALIDQHPDVLTAHSDRLLLRSYRQQRADEAEGLRAQARAFGERLPAAGPRPAAARRSGLRVGLVSADLRQHPVGRLAMAWLPALARQAEVVVYDNAREGDGLTAALRPAVAGWREVALLDDEAVSRQIAADGIDVLVDLNGHTGGHRLGVFARRPARRQFSWLGYAGSTGLAQMDGFIADRWLVPPAGEAAFVEPVLRLAHSFTVYAPPAFAPAVGPLGARPRFGSFNGLHKLSDAVLALWSRMLAAVPDSRLLIQAPGLQHAAERAALLARWPGDPGQLDLAGPLPLQDYLAAMGSVDLMLDPFPYSGGMTSLDALWMGVPVLTLPGPAPIARQGLSFLQTLGLAQDWVARDEDDAVQRVAAWAEDRAGLAALRAGLRQRMADSPLCDADSFARDWISRVTA